MGLLGQQLLTSRNTSFLMTFQKQAANRKCPIEYFIIFSFMQMNTTLLYCMGKMYA